MVPRIIIVSFYHLRAIALQNEDMEAALQVLVGKQWSVKCAASMTTTEHAITRVVDFSEQARRL